MTPFRENAAPWALQDKAPCGGTWRNAALWTLSLHLNALCSWKTASQDAKVAPEFRNHNQALSEPKKMPPSGLPNRWKRRPKMQVPPLSLSNTTRRPLNLKKMPPSELPNQGLWTWKRRPKMQISPLSSATTTERPLNLKMPSSELPNRWKRRPKMQVPPLSSSSTIRRPLNLKNAALWASQPRTLNLKTAPPRYECRPWVPQPQPCALLIWKTALKLPTRWKRRPKMQMPPLSSATTTGRPLILKNAALWACHQVKMAPKDASAAPCPW